MAFEFERPRFASFPTMQGYLDRLLDMVAAKFDRHDDTLTALVQIGKAQGVTVSWLWEEGTDTSVEPADGSMRGNNVLLSGITQLAISRVELFGRELGGDAVALMEPGDQLLVSDRQKNVEYLYTLDAAPEPMGEPFSWAQIDVTPVSGVSGNPNAGDITELTWLPPIEPPD